MSKDSALPTTVALEDLDLREAAIKFAEEKGIDPDLFLRLVETESGFNPEARNEKSGAFGLGQIVYEANPQFEPTTDPRRQLEQSATKLDTLLDRYDQNPAAALAAYNYGDGNTAKAIADQYGIEYKDGADAVRKVKAAGLYAQLPKDASFADKVKLPAETKNYIKKILSGKQPTTKERKAFAKVAVNNPQDLIEYVGPVNIYPELQREGILPKYLPSEEASTLNVLGSGSLSALAGLAALTNMVAPEGGAFDEITQKAAEYLQQHAEEMLTPEERELLGKEFLTTDLSKSAFFDPNAFWTKLIHSAPMTATSLIAGIGAGLTGAGIKTAITLGATLEGMFGAGDAARAIADEIRNMDEKTFRQRFPEFNGLPLAQAKEAAVNQRRLLVVPLVGGADAILSALGLKAVPKGKTFIRRALRAGAEESATEALQSAQEQLGQNIAVREPSIAKGVGEAAVSGIALGFGMGIGLGGFVKREEPAKGVADEERRKNREKVVPPEAAAAISEATRKKQAEPVSSTPLGGVSSGAEVIEPAAPLGGVASGAAPAEPPVLGGAVSGAQPMSIPELDLRNTALPQPAISLNTSDYAEPDLSFVPPAPTDKRALDMDVAGLELQERPTALPEPARTEAELLRREIKRRRRERRIAEFNERQDKSLREEAAKVQRQLKGEFAEQLELPIEQQPPAEQSKTQRRMLRAGKAARAAEKTKLETAKKTARAEVEKRNIDKLLKKAFVDITRKEKSKGTLGTTANREARFALLESLAQHAYTKSKGEISAEEITKLMLGDQGYAKFASLVREAYAKNPEKILDLLSRFGHTTEKLQISGQGQPRSVTVPVGIKAEATRLKRKRRQLIAERERLKVEQKRAEREEQALLKRKEELKEKVETLQRNKAEAIANKKLAAVRKKLQGYAAKIAETEKQIESIEKKTKELEKQRKSLFRKENLPEQVERATAAIYEEEFPSVVRKEETEAQPQQLELFPGSKEKLLREERKQLEIRLVAKRTRKVLETAKRRERERAESTRTEAIHGKSGLSTEELQLGELGYGPTFTSTVMVEGRSIYSNEEVDAELAEAPFTNVDVVTAAEIAGKRIQKRLESLAALKKKSTWSREAVRKALYNYLIRKARRAASTSTRNRIIGLVLKKYLAGQLPYKKAIGTWKNRVDELEVQIRLVLDGQEVDNVTANVLASEVRDRWQNVIDLRQVPPKKAGLGELLMKAFPVEVQEAKQLMALDRVASKVLQKSLPDYVYNALVRLNDVDVDIALDLKQMKRDAKVAEKNLIERLKLQIPELSREDLTEEQRKQLYGRVRRFLERQKGKIALANRTQLDAIMRDLLGVESLLGVDPSPKLFEFVLRLNLRLNTFGVDKKELIKSLREIGQRMLKLVKLYTDRMAAQEGTERYAEIQRQIDELENIPLAEKGSVAWRALRMADKIEGVESGTESGNEPAGTTDAASEERRSGGEGAVEVTSERRESGIDPAEYAGVPSNDQLVAAERAVNRVSNGQNFLLADSTGFGKTIQMLVSANEFLKRNKTGRVVFILTKKDHYQNFLRDADKLGIGDLMTSGRVVFKTYADLRTDAEAIAALAEGGMLIVDEAHLIKNPFSSNYEAYRKVADSAKGALLATATPLDSIAHLPVLAEALGVDLNDLYNKLGIELSKNSKGEVQAALQPGITIGDVVTRIFRLIGGLIEDGGAVARTAMRRTKFTLKNLKSSNLAVRLGSTVRPLSEWEAAIQSKLKKAGRLSASKYVSELAKLPVAANMAKEAVQSGRRVIIVVSKDKATKLRLGDAEYDLHSPTEELAQLLKKSGLSFRVLTGSAEVKQAIADFQKGKLDVIITTNEKLGTGYDLDDQTGERPRTLIFTNFSFSAIGLDQMLGRIERRNTKSVPEAVFLSTDTFADTNERVAVTVKSKLLEASRGGVLAGLPDESVLENGIASPYVIDESQADSQDRVVVKLNTAFFKDAYGTFKPAVNLLKSLKASFNKETQVAMVPRKNLDKLRAGLDEIITGIKPPTKRVAQDLRMPRNAPIDERWKKTAGALKAEIEIRALQGRQLTSQEVLDIIIANSTGLLRKLAKVFKATGVDIPVSILADVGSDRGATATYVSSIDNEGRVRKREILLEAGSKNVLREFLHEFAHAVTLHGLNKSNPLARRMNVLFNKFRAAAETQGIEAYGFEDLAEFVAEILVNPEFQQQLREIAYSTKESLWDRFVAIAHKAIRFLSGRPLESSKRMMQLLDEVMSISEQLIMDETQLAEINVRDHIMEKYSKVADKVTANFVAEYAGKAASAFTGAGTRSTLRRNVKLPFMTLRQIVEVYKDKFKEFKPTFGTKENVLEHLIRLYSLKDNFSHKLQRSTFPLAREWEAYRSEQPEQEQWLSYVMDQATTYEMDITVPFDHPNNRHLRETPSGNPLPKEAVEKSREIHKELQNIYNNLVDERGHKIFDAARQYYEQAWASVIVSLKSNLLYDKELMQVLDIDSMEALRAYVNNINTKEDVDALVEKLKENGVSETVANNIGDSLDIINSKARIKGVYFPRRRFGDYVVVAHTPERVFEFDSKEEAEANKQAAKREYVQAEVSALKQDEESGKYYYTVRSKVVQFFESFSEAEQYRNQVLKDIDAGLYEKVSNVMHKDTFYQEERISSAFLDKALANVQDPELQKTLKITLLQMMPEGSVRKAELQRKNVAGASMDMLRAFAAHTRSNAFYMAQLYYGVQLQETMREIHQQVQNTRYSSDAETMELQDVLHELRVRDALNAKAPFRTRTELITELGFVSYLTSPSYWFINASQPLLITMPWLGARYGMNKSRKAMMAAYKATFPEVFRKMKGAKLGFGFLSGKDVPHELFDFLTSDGAIGPELIKNIENSDSLKHKIGVVAMLTELGETNLIDMTFAADVKALAQGVSTKKSVQYWKRTIDWARIMPHLVEIMNRTTTAVAAYELAREQGASHEAAVRAAEQAVAATQFDYSAVNKPRYFSEKQFALARPIFMFMQYTQHMYFMMLRSMLLDGAGKQVITKLLRGEKLTEQEKEKVKTSVKTFLYVTASHMMVAGTIGGLFEPIKWAIGAALWVLSAAVGDDEPFDPETEYRKLLADVFGKEGGAVVAKGLPMIFGIDLSTRINLNRLLFFDNPVRGEGHEAVRNFFVQVGGPIVAMAEKMADGVKNLAEGDYAGGAEQLLAPVPKLFRDMIKVVRYANNGIMDAGGNIIYPSSDINPWELFVQFFGITPANISEFYDERRSVKSALQYYNREKAKLLERYFRADPATRAKMRASDIPRFNRSAPYGMRITPDTLKRSLGAHDRTGRQARLHGGVPLSPKQRYLYEKYGDFGAY